MAVSIMTTKQITQLDHSMRAAHNVLLGTRINEMQYGAIPTIATGEVLPMAVVKYKTAPAIGTAVATHAAVAQAATAVTVTTGFTQPDYPRNLTIKGNASGISGDVVLTGTDFNDAVLTETIALNGSTEVVGTKCFKSIVSAVLPIETHAGTDTISIGRGNLIGFPIPIPATSLVISKMFNSLIDAGTVTAGATVAVSHYAPAGTMNGAKPLELVFLA